MDYEHILISPPMRRMSGGSTTSVFYRARGGQRLWAKILGGEPLFSCLGFRRLRRPGGKHLGM